MKRCSKCGVDKPIDDFPWKNKLLNRRHAVCKPCTAIRSSKWYNENKQSHIENVGRYREEFRSNGKSFIWDYLSAHPCVDCGETNPLVLEFDHVRGNKKQTVSVMVTQGYSIENIQKEIDKCEVRCANCHRIKTAKERGWFSK